MKCTYAEVEERLGLGEPLLPVLYLVKPDFLEVYLPIWTPKLMILAMQARCAAQWQSAAVQVILVTDCPRLALCGEWRRLYDSQAR